MGEPQSRHYLDEPFILARLAILQALALLKPHSRTDMSALEEPMRDRLARICMRLAEMERALHLHATHILEDEAERRRREEPEP